MISCYRLGDLLFAYLHDYEKDRILRNHPNSIGSKFIIEKRIRNSRDSTHDMGIITAIVLKYIERNLDKLPKNIADSTVIHLRLGDAVAGNEYHEKQRRPLEVDYLKSLVVNDTNPKYVIGKFFFHNPDDLTDYEECVHKSNTYLHNVINELHAEHFNSGDADIDLCCAVKAKLFIQGRGFFSKLIVDIRKRLNLNSIETAPFCYVPDSVNL